MDLIQDLCTLTQTKVTTGQLGEGEVRGRERKGLKVGDGRCPAEGPLASRDVFDTRKREPFSDSREYGVLLSKGGIFHERETQGPGDTIVVTPKKKLSCFRHRKMTDHETPIFFFM